MKRHYFNRAEHCDIEVIGLGNRFTTDDGIGFLIADAIAAHDLRGVRVYKYIGEGISLTDLWQNASLAIVIDAVCADGLPGTVCRFEASPETINSGFFNYSIHALHVGEAIEFSKTMNCTLPAIIIYGIHGADFGIGRQVTPEITTATPNIVAQIVKDIRQFRESSELV